MRFVLLCAALAAAALGAPPSYMIPERFRGGEMYRQMLEEEQQAQRASGITPNRTENYLDQPVDHNWTRLGTFKQRYFIDTSGWRNGSDYALLAIGGEWVVSSSEGGFAAEWIQSLGGLIVSLEHRWYGKSALGNYTNLTLLNRLTVENALADIRTFMLHIEKQFNQTFRWAIVGGSYPGGLAAWFKVRYPDAVLASWSSSGVTNPRFDYSGYEGHVVNLLQPDCRRVLVAAIDELESFWDDRERFIEVQKWFGLREPVDKPTFGYVLGDAYSGPVQYGRRVAFCDALLADTDPSPLKRFANAANKVNGANHASKVTQAQKQKVYDSMYLWNFQCCIEMAFWQIAYPRNDESECIRPSVVTTDWFMDVCHTDYNVTGIPALYTWAEKYGGAFPFAKNVIATHGSEDPFAPAGVYTQVNRDYPYLLAQCDTCGHCADLRSQSPNDPPALKQQRRMIVQYMNKWMGAAYNVTFVLASTTKPHPDIVEAAIMKATNQPSWLYGFVFECGAKKDVNVCRATFNSKLGAAQALKLANSNAIEGVTEAYEESSSGQDEGDEGTSKYIVLGVVASGSAFVLVLALAAVVLVIRKKKASLDGYSSLN